MDAKIKEKFRKEDNLNQLKAVYNDIQKKINNLSSLVAELSYNHGKYVQNVIFTKSTRIHDVDFYGKEHDEARKEIGEKLKEAKKILDEIVRNYPY